MLQNVTKKLKFRCLLNKMPMLQKNRPQKTVCNDIVTVEINVLQNYGIFPNFLLQPKPISQLFLILRIGSFRNF